MSNMIGKTLRTPGAAITGAEAASAILSLRPSNRKVHMGNGQCGGLTIGLDRDFMSQITAFHSWKEAWEAMPLGSKMIVLEIIASQQWGSRRHRRETNVMVCCAELWAPSFSAASRTSFDCAFEFARGSDVTREDVERCYDGHVFNLAVEREQHFMPYFSADAAISAAAFGTCSRRLILEDGKKSTHNDSITRILDTFYPDGPDVLDAENEFAEKCT